MPVRVYVVWGLRLEGARSRRQAVLLWAVERLAILLATDVLCVSESLREEAAARKLFGRRDRPGVIGDGSSNGVNPDRWDPGFAAVDREAVRKSWRARPDELVVGFVGRIAFDKGVQDLLDAVRVLDDVPIRLVLVGPVEDEPLRQAIGLLGERITHVDQWLDDPHPVYVGIDVLCLPTRREGSPTSCSRPRWPRSRPSRRRPPESGLRRPGGHRLDRRHGAPRSARRRPADVRREPRSRS